MDETAVGLDFEVLFTKAKTNERAHEQPTDKKKENQSTTTTLNFPVGKKVSLLVYHERNVFWEGGWQKRCSARTNRSKRSRKPFSKSDSQDSGTNSRQNKENLVWHLSATDHRAFEDPETWWQIGLANFWTPLNTPPPPRKNEQNDQRYVCPSLDKVIIMRPTLLSPCPSDRAIIMLPRLRLSQLTTLRSSWLWQDKNYTNNAAFFLAPTR